MEVNPVFRGRGFKVRKDLCFVLMPLHDPFTSIFEQHIKPAAEKNGLVALKADDIYSNKPVMEDVWNYLNQARLVIADLTDSNPNVFYELGIAHTLGKEVIMIAQHITKIPFDVGHVRYINYVYPSEIERFDVRLRDTIAQVLRDSTVELRPAEPKSKKEATVLTSTNLRTQRLESLASWAREWVTENFSKIMRDAHYSPRNSFSYWAVVDTVEDGVKAEAVKRWGLSTATAKDYADVVWLTIEPGFKERIEVDVKKEEEERSKREEQERRATPPAKVALEVFSALETPAKLPVERSRFKAELLRRDGVTDEGAEKVIRMMFREGWVYETKPGFLRRLASAG